MPYADRGDVDEPNEPTRQDAGGAAFGVLDQSGDELVHVGDIPYGAPLTVPRRSGSAAESLLAEANNHAREVALRRLAVLFAGYDFEAAAQNVDDRRFTVLALDPEAWEGIVSAGSIDALLALHDHQWGLGGVSFAHEDVHGHQPPPPRVAIGPENVGRGWLEIGELVDALGNGWTAILNGADRFEPALAAIARDLSAAYGARVNINTYISQGGAGGFGPHWDTHDAIIVPVTGRKRWSVFEPSVLAAQRPWSGAEVSTKHVWNDSVEPGTALVVPRGWGHTVESSHELSIHHTIGITRLEAHHVFERVAFEAGMQPSMRADFPFDLDRPIASYADTVFDDPQGFARTTALLLTPELVDRAMATFRARLPGRTRTSTTATFRATKGDDWSGLAITINAPGGIMLGDESANHLVVALAGRAMRLPAAAVEALAALASGSTVAIADTPAVEIDGRDRTKDFITALILRGIVTVHANQAHD